MPVWPCIKVAPYSDLSLRLLMSAAAVSLLAGCSLSSPDRATLAPRPAPTASAQPKDTAALRAATAFWGKTYLENPKDARAALSYALNLKAMGDKARAMEVLKRAHGYHPSDTRIASEYGRLALDANQFDLADQLLSRAERGGSGPDWRVLSAKGTLHAKKGEYGKAQKFYLAALKHRPKAPSLMNNLALAYALGGKADQAEPLLREAISSGRDIPRVRQNLALVLGLQGKFGEARQLASVDLSGDQANANMTYLRSMVRDEIKLAATKAPPAPAVSPNVSLASAPDRGPAAATLVSLEGRATPAASGDWSAVVIESTPAPKAKLSFRR